MPIKVTLNPAGRVVLAPSIKDIQRNGTSHSVRWERGDDQDFVFVDLKIEAPDGVFDTPVVEEETITVINNIGEIRERVSYPYRVHVMTPDGEVYSSEGEDSEFESGRGVIRNLP